MRIFSLIVFFFISATLQLQAQRELLNPLIDSKDVIAKGVALHDAGKYKEAIAQYLKVPASDTAYSAVLHELILSYYRDSNFVDAEKYGKIALTLYPDNNTEWYSLLADVYDDTKRSDEAIKAYDTIIAQNPNNYLAFFNKGVTLFRLEKYDEATANFQRCIIINPYYTSAHYFLGMLCMLKGNMVQAMMSFATSLMISPSNRYHSTTANFLNTIAEVNTTATGYLQKYKPGKEDNFEDIQEILVSKAALDKKYKLKADIDDQIVRQLQVVMEKLEYNANDKGFWMQYYVPLFKNLWDKDHFEPMVFYMFSGLDIKKVKDYQQKEKKKITSFSDDATTYLSAIRESQELVFTKREKATPKYSIKDFEVSGKGNYGTNNKNQEVVIGPWEFYYSTGRVKSKGSFNSEGLHTGDWQYFYESGLQKEVTNYKDNKAQGSSQSWNDNGLLYNTSTYADDKLDGKKTTYFYSGRLASVINYKEDKKEGIAKFYNIDGYLKTVCNYSNGLQEGAETVYHANGKIESTASYSNDKLTGEYKEYFDNDNLKIKGNYIDSKKTGEWITYFIDGKTEQVENFTKGELEGDCVSYYANGKVESKCFYKKGEIEDKKQDFDDDGILYCETIFEKGRLKSIKFFDKKGTVISNTTSRKGNANVAFYSAAGNKISEGYYSKEGLAEGKFNYYFRNNQVSGESYYKNGLHEGKKTTYYANNKISSEANYKADKADGYFVNYYNNGQVADEGWYVDDERQGTFIYYDLLGHITSKIYYLNGKVHGIAEYYTASGNLDYKEYYDNGWFNKIEQYDSTGKLFVTSRLNKGEGKVHFNHFNGKPYFESNYKYYKQNGMYTVTNGDGSKRSVNYNKNGNMDSAYIAWHPNGKIQVEGQYIDGAKTGTWKYYYFDGRLYETEHYEEGKLNGGDILYNDFGAIAKQSNYKNGELQGESKFYGDNNLLMAVFYYKDDELLSYSYEDKTGKLVPAIPLVKGSGVVESYYRNGVKSLHMVFNEGIVNGDRTFYYSSGKEETVGARVNGLENGSRKVYYPSGKLMKEGNYYYGEEMGSFKYYNENGTLISDLNFYLGNLHGECKYYTAGKLTQTYLYYYGVLESKK